MHITRLTTTFLFLVMLMGTSALFAACAETDHDEPTNQEPFEPIPWPESPEVLERNERDWREVRAIIHLHSPHSHDACDGNPQPGGSLDEGCLSDLRWGLCSNRIDVAFLTDHPGHASDANFEDLLLLRDGDEPISNDSGVVVANRIHCDGGHEVLLMPGIETSRMMPLGLEAHVRDAYSPGLEADFDAIQAAGAVAWVAHTEGRDIEELASLGIEGIELYQLHANIDPKLREERLGLEGTAALTELAPFFFPVEADGEPPHPDLAPLGFLVPNEPSINALEFLGQTQRIGVSGGTDAHQNVLSAQASDGERMDSYRRLMRWFNTRLRIRGELVPGSAREALREARTWISFEIFGTPLGFDLIAENHEQTFEIGAELPHQPSLVIRARLPSLDPSSPRSEEPPPIRGLLYRATPQGRELIAEWSKGEIEMPVSGPGVYRMEAWITPTHLKPYLGDRPDLADKEVPWLYSGAIFIRPAS
jgi:hypothetical protein